MLSSVLELLLDFRVFFGSLRPEWLLFMHPCRLITLSHCGFRDSWLRADGPFVRVATVLAQDIGTGRRKTRERLLTVGV